MLSVQVHRDRTSRDYLLDWCLVSSEVALRRGSFYVFFVRREGPMLRVLCVFGTFYGQVDGTLLDLALWTPCSVASRSVS